MIAGIKEFFRIMFAPLPKSKTVQEYYKENLAAWITAMNNDLT
jgi:hypothetical protein